METDFRTMIGTSSWWRSEQLAAINPSDDDNDDGDDEEELQGAAQVDDVQSILSKNPWLIRIADPVGDNILHMSVRNGDIEIVYKLIAFMDEHGHKDLKKKGLKDKIVDGDTPLHVALKNGHIELAYHLVNAEQKTAFISNNDGITQLQLASEVGFSEVSFLPRLLLCQALISDVEIEIMKWELMRMSSSVATHWNELCIAIEKGPEDVIETVLTTHDKNLLCWQDKQTWKILLHEAVRAGHVKQLVQFIVDNGLTCSTSWKQKGRYSFARGCSDKQIERYTLLDQGGTNNRLPSKSQGCLTAL
ncbi:hypothetical protein RND81_11G017700 [Saponaria officinalis]|uniref:Uncharacterized protein n=1 Tax=Saponaria officinalis TaxID=3572 RepID=A0AAW1HGZ3_SAPOF